MSEPKLTLEYWDCECETDYIHPVSEDICPVCDAMRVEQPLSHINEVIEAGFELMQDETWHTSSENPYLLTGDELGRTEQRRKAGINW